MSEKLSYDEIRCPGIGQTIHCKPEVQEFAVGEELYRVVLLGKTGLHGYKEEPHIVVERRINVDALGVVAWGNLHETKLANMLAGLYAACRKTAREAVAAKDAELAAIKKASAALA